jgi:hypothetical protein
LARRTEAGKPANVVQKVAIKRFLVRFFKPCSE